MAEGKRGLWWWIDRWRRSSAFIDMTLAEQGAYRNLLDELRLRGGRLPNDERTLAKACGDPLEWPAVRDKVMAKFRLVDGAWENTTATEVNAVSDAILEAKAKGGKVRAAAANREGGRFTSSHQQNDQQTGQQVASRSVAVAVSGAVSVADRRTNGGGSEQPMDVRTETAIRASRVREERELLAVVGRIAEKADKDPTEVMREVTAYRARDGTIVGGKTNPATLQSAERVTKSLDDAKAWLAELEKT